MNSSEVGQRRGVARAALHVNSNLEYFFFLTMGSTWYSNMN